jgi:hypothetical protein
MLAEITAAVRRQQQEAEARASMGDASPHTAPSDIEPVELVHRLKSHCPVDVVADTLDAWISPVVQRVERAGAAPGVRNACIEGCVWLLLTAAQTTQGLRTRARAAEDALRTEGNALQAGELAAALNRTQQQVAALEDELTSMQETHLAACESFLVKAAAHQRQLDGKNEELTQLHHEVMRLASRAEAAEGELQRLRHRHGAEAQRGKDMLFDESARSGALRGAWRRAEEERDELRERLLLLGGEHAASEDHRQLELSEAAARNQLVAEHAREALLVAGLEPFKRAVANAARLRSVLLSR